MIFILVLVVCREMCMSELDRFQYRMSRRLCVWLKKCSVIFGWRWKEVGGGLALASCLKNHTVVPPALCFFCSCKQPKQTLRK